VNIRLYSVGTSYRTFVTDVRNILYPAFCTRLIEVKHHILQEEGSPKDLVEQSPSFPPTPSPSAVSDSSKRPEHQEQTQQRHDDDDASESCRSESYSGYTEINLFQYQVYSKILYISSECLVQKDVSHLLNIQHNVSNRGLIAAGKKLHLCLAHCSL